MLDFLGKLHFHPDLIQFLFQCLQEKCNNQECQWDGTDCTLSRDPWANCSAVGVECWKHFDNGVCDKKCNNPLCLFDGHDCLNKVEKCQLVLTTRLSIWGHLGVK